MDFSMAMQGQLAKIFTELGSHPYVFGDGLHAWAHVELLGLI
jgi:hypothetical protein